MAEAAPSREVPKKSNGIVLVRAEGAHFPEYPNGVDEMDIGRPWFDPTRHPQTSAGRNLPPKVLPFGGIACPSRQLQS